MDVSDEVIILRALAGAGVMYLLVSIGVVLLLRGKQNRVKFIGLAIVVMGIVLGALVSSGHMGVI